MITDDEIPRPVPWSERLAVLDDPTTGTGRACSVARALANDPSLARDASFMTSAMLDLVPLAEREVEDYREWDYNTAERDRVDGPLHELTVMLAAWLHALIWYDSVKAFGSTFLAMLRDADRTAIAAGGAGRLEMQGKYALIDYGVHFQVRSATDVAYLEALGSPVDWSPLVVAAAVDTCEPGEALVDGFGLAMALRRYAADRA